MRSNDFFIWALRRSNRSLHTQKKISTTKIQQVQNTTYLVHRSTKNFLKILASTKYCFNPKNVIFDTCYISLYFYRGGVPRGASPPPPPGILAFPSIPSTQNAFPLHKTAYAFRDICYITNYICYITNSYNSWKICLKILPIYWFYHLPSCFTAYILILPPAKLTLLPANEQSPPATIPSEPPFQCDTT